MSNTSFREDHIKSAELSTGTLVLVEPVLPISEEDTKEVQYSIQIEQKYRATTNIVLTRDDMLALKEAIDSLLEDTRF